MWKLSAGLWCLAAAAAVSGQRQQTPATAAKTLQLEVRSKSWLRKSAGFDQAGLTRQCETAQIALTSHPAPDGLLTIEYSEVQSGVYGNLSSVIAQAYGTKISFKLELRPPVNQKAVLSLKAGGDSQLTGSSTADFYQQAVNDLKREFNYQFACSAVAAALGVRVEAETAASTVPGLFAAGEVAAGLHGAARLGGNALSEALVFGRRAGLHAAQYCRARAGRTTIDGREVEAHARALLAPLQRTGSENPFALQRELQDCMHRFVGVARTGEELSRARKKIEELGRRSRNVAVAGGRAYNPGWHLALDLHSLLSVSEATALAAIERKESRGCHLRRDFPGADPRYVGMSIVVTRSKHGLVVSRRRLAETPEELKRLVDWSKKWLAKKPASESGAAMPAAAGSKNIA